MRTSIDGAISWVLRSGWYLPGFEVQSFEEEFAAYCRRPYAVAVGNGTNALELSLRSVSCSAGDEVITVANAGMYTITACLHIGAVPVFADVNEENPLVSPSLVESLITEQTPAIVMTYLFGHLADMESIQRAVGGKDIAIIEDFF